MTIAVTGPLASGKSTLVKMIGELGADTISSDEMVHYLLAEDEETIATVARRFGEGVRGERGIDRKALAREVFGKGEALRDVEGILHPRVREETDKRAAASRADLFVAEIPLLFEGGGEERFDLTVAVTTPDERRQGWAEKRGMGEDQRRAIEARQLTGQEKARRADVVVENDGDQDRLREKAKALVEQVLGEKGFDSEEGARE
ncbi:MAG TPA: dephospho-CoA kinase [Rubrobacteraceae bacterium]|nr:dephospho-CoA kinase [Rubrobacteraceae bacterium]